MAFCFLATLVGLIMLAVLLIDVLRDGWDRLSYDFINSFPSARPEKAGIKAALWGSIWMVGMTAVFAVPIGIGAAIYLEEYAPKHWITRVLQTNIANLAGVPSIVYGLLGLAIFVRQMELGRSLLAGSLTMALLVLPIIIIASQEAIRAVPPPTGRERSPWGLRAGRSSGARCCRQRCRAYLPASSWRSPAPWARRRR